MRHCTFVSLLILTGVFPGLVSAAGPQETPQVFPSLNVMLQWDDQGYVYDPPAQLASLLKWRQSDVQDAQNPHRIELEADIPSEQSHLIPTPFRAGQGVSSFCSATRETIETEVRRVYLTGWRSAETSAAPYLVVVTTETGHHCPPSSYRLISPRPFAPQRWKVIDASEELKDRVRSFLGYRTGEVTLLLLPDRERVYIVARNAGQIDAGKSWGQYYVDVVAEDERGELSVMSRAEMPRPTLLLDLDGDDLPEYAVPAEDGTSGAKLCSLVRLASCF